MLTSDEQSKSGIGVSPLKRSSYGGTGDRASILKFVMKLGLARIHSKVLLVRD